MENGAMERKPPPKRESKPGPPKWNSPIWYLPIMLLLLWAWQSTISQFSYRPLSYSEFKDYLRRGQLVKCVIKTDTVEGEINPTLKPIAQPGTNVALPTPGSLTNTARSSSTNSESKPFLFRVTRVEDPKLVEELEQLGVQFRGERPSLFSQFVVSWML